MRLRVITPEGTLLDRETDSVTLLGSDGWFTVQNHHAPLVSALVAGRMEYDDGGQKTFLEIGNGVAEVRQNTVTVFTE